MAGKFLTRLYKKPQWRFCFRFWRDLKVKFLTSGLKLLKPWRTLTTKTLVTRTVTKKTNQTAAIKNNIVFSNKSIVVRFFLPTKPVECARCSSSALFLLKPNIIFRLLPLTF